MSESSNSNRFRKIRELLNTVKECYNLYTEIRTVLSKFGILHPRGSRLDIMDLAVMMALGRRKLVKRKVNPEVHQELQECIEAIDTLREVYDRMYRGGYEELLELVTAKKIEEREEEEEIAEEEVEKIIDKFKQKRRLGFNQA